MRLVHDVGAPELTRFLADTEYPCEWSEEILATYCLKTRIEAPCGSVAGYVWLHWITGADRVLDFHIALHPNFERRVLSRRVVASIIAYARGLGARTLIARPITRTHAALMPRLGFSLIGPFAFLPLDPLPESLPASVQRAVARAEERKPHG